MASGCSTHRMPILWVSTTSRSRPTSKQTLTRSKNCRTPSPLDLELTEVGYIWFSGLEGEP